MWVISEGVAYNLAAALWARRTGDCLVVQFPGHTVALADADGALAARVGFTGAVTPPPPPPAPADRGRGTRR